MCWHNMRPVVIDNIITSLIHGFAVYSWSCVNRNIPNIGPDILQITFNGCVTEGNPPTHNHDAKWFIYLFFLISNG